jgi:DNA-binding NarL/FixJ family response regulator
MAGSPMQGREVTCVLKAMVVDDSAMMRKVIRDTLATMPGRMIVGEAANGQEALEVALALHPDLVVLDVHMPVMGGLEALRLLKAASPSVHVVMVTTILDPWLRDHALGSGAAACLQKGPKMWEDLPRVVGQLFHSAHGGPHGSCSPQGVSGEIRDE